MVDWKDQLLTSQNSDKPKRYMARRRFAVRFFAMTEFHIREQLPNLHLNSAPNWPPWTQIAKHEIDGHCGLEREHFVHISSNFVSAANVQKTRRTAQHPIENWMPVLTTRLEGLQKSSKSALCVKGPLRLNVASNTTGSSQKLPIVAPAFEGLSKSGVECTREVVSLDNNNPLN